jgi:hypothetical protein
VYRFIFSEDREEAFEVHLDENTLDPVDKITESLPDWTRLDFHQCPNCPLNLQEHPHFPLSVRLVKLVTRFEDIVSHETLRVVAETPARTVVKDASAQEGVSSLMGLIMATSGCPRTALFKPMARFHLPMANGAETVYRASSMYLLSQYFVHKSGGKPDLDLVGLKRFYEELQILNGAMANRIRAAISQDAAVNALVILDFFALRFSFEVEDQLTVMRPLFDAYFNEESSNSSS